MNTTEKLWIGIVIAILIVALFVNTAKGEPYIEITDMHWANTSYLDKTWPYAWRVSACPGETVSPIIWFENTGTPENLSGVSFRMQSHTSPDHIFWSFHRFRDDLIGVVNWTEFNGLDMEEGYDILIYVGTNHQVTGDHPDNWTHDDWQKYTLPVSYCGDVNDDRLVNINDVIELYLWIVDNKRLTKHKEVGDVDNSFGININDVIQLYLHIVDSEQYPLYDPGGCKCIQE